MKNLSRPWRGVADQSEFLKFNSVRMARPSTVEIYGDRVRLGIATDGMPEPRSLDRYYGQVEEFVANDLA